MPATTASARTKKKTSTSDPFQPEQFIILDTPDWQDVHFLEDRLYEYNVASTGISDGRLLAIFLRDPQETLIAGLYGWTWGGCCEVKTLWVHEKLLGRGLGTHLMQAAEQEARLRGATQIVLNTQLSGAPFL